MIESSEASDLIRRLSRLKGYPRSWDQSSGSAAAEQDAAAEAALIQAAAEAPSVSRLRQFVSDWERRHVEAPVPAALYEAWRGAPQYAGIRRRRCGACGDAGWVTRYYVADSIAGENAERIYIGEAEVADWWERIRSNKSCAQRVYEEAVRCGCSSTTPEIQKDVVGDGAAYRDFAQKAAGDI